ncbi:hypothetical protein [Nonomuraea sp. NPDC046570]|uniref:hypothetical protein n=1 Tax=Nonomuraea sp. NPDC046570 TaxID=3155255 RepID=UPI0034097D74
MRAAQLGGLLDLVDTDDTVLLKVAQPFGELSGMTGQRPITTAFAAPAAAPLCPLRRSLSPI